MSPAGIPDEPQDFDPLADPELRSLAAELRSAWQADYEELADEARMHREHRFRLVDRIEEAMARGDRLQIAVGDLVWTGIVDGLGTDRCTLDTGTDLVDIRLAISPARIGAPVVIRRVARGSSGGKRASQPPMGFRARCYEREMTRQAVRVGSAISDEMLTGTLTVGADHLVITGPDGDTFLALDWVSWITTASTEFWRY